MDRTLHVGMVEDEDGVYFDRQDAEQKLAFALDVIENFGGTWGLVPHREQQQDGEYALVGLKLIYNSFVPAKKLEAAPEPVDEPEPVAA